jgi:drug/metabolite transporter (DMT)-like permease
MTRILLMLCVLICCSTGGEIAMTYGMKQVGEPESFRPMALLRFIFKAVRSTWVWLALPLMAISFYALLILLSWAPISLVIPASAFSYVVGTLGAKYILKEEICRARWIGVIMVCIGVAIATIG